MISRRHLHRIPFKGGAVFPLPIFHSGVFRLEEIDPHPLTRLRRVFAAEIAMEVTGLKPPTVGQLILMARRLVLGFQ